MQPKFPSGDIINVTDGIVTLTMTKAIESESQSMQPQFPSERHRSEQPKCPKDIISRAPAA